jgi:hypothetical protein
MRHNTALANSNYIGDQMSKFTRIFLACLCLGVAAMGPSTAFAAKKKKAKSHRVSKKENRDTADERRLKRECKGQVNAGACAGYTR